MKAKESFSPNALSCKIVLVGESSVGKTSIINRFMKNTFTPNTMTTPGASFVTKSMTFLHLDKTINFEIWDTAGQERFRALSKIFYKQATAVILVYDITNKDSFDAIGNYWLNQIKESAPKDVIIAIAANKCDLFENEEVNEAKARDYANYNGAIFKLTSAKSAIGVEEMFIAIGNKVFNPEAKIEEIEIDASIRPSMKLNNSESLAVSRNSRSCCGK